MLTELDRENTTLKKTPGKKRPDDIDDDLDEWFFIDRERLDSGLNLDVSVEQGTLKIDLELRQLDQRS